MKNKNTFHTLFRNIKSGWLVLGAPKGKETDLSTDTSLDTDLERLGAIEIGVDANGLALVGIV